MVASKTLDISQGSVATHLRCCGIFSDSINRNFLLIQIVKYNCENRLIYGKVKAYNNGANFWATLHTFLAMYDGL